MHFLTLNTDQLRATPPTKAIAHPLFWPFSTGRFWDGGLRALILGVAVPGASHGHTEAAHKISPHSVTGGPTSPHPPTKAIAHPSFGPFSAGRFWDRGLRALVFGRGCARGIPRAHGGCLQSLAPFRVRQTNFAPPHQGYSPPPVLALSRWAVWGWGPSGARFWLRPCAGYPAGKRRPLARFGPLQSPADQLRPTPPPRL